MTQTPVQSESGEHNQGNHQAGAEQARPPGNRTPLFEASNAARYHRQEIIKRIQKRTQRRLICYVSGNGCMIEWDDTMPFIDLLHNVPPGVSVDLLLHTLGGIPDAAEKLVHLIRKKVGDAEFRIIVPEMAKSAGTLMVLGADCVVMSDASELGPIDPQVRLPDSNGVARSHSAQHYLDAYEEYYERLNEDPTDSSAQVMLGKFDPATILRVRTIMARARQSARDLLVTGMFREGGAWTIASEALLDTRRWLSHSQMISWEDAQDPNVGLKVQHHDHESDVWQDYWQLYCLQRLAIVEGEKLFESDYVSLPVRATTLLT